jgi:hypothetical protein
MHYLEDYRVAALLPLMSGVTSSIPGLIYTSANLCATGHAELVLRRLLRAATGRMASLQRCGPGPTTNTTATECCPSCPAAIYLYKPSGLFPSLVPDVMPTKEHTWCSAEPRWACGMYAPSGIEH